MPVSIKRLKVGDNLWSSSRQKMGNTTMRETVFHPVRIHEIAPDYSYALVSWNFNPPKKVWATNGKLPYSRSRPEKK